MPLTNAAKNLSLDQLGAAITHVGLHSSYHATGGNELSGSPYTRKAVAWAAAAQGSKETQSAVDFDVPGGSTVRWAGLWGAASGGTFYGAVPLGPIGEPRLAFAGSADNMFRAAGHDFANGQTVAVTKTHGALPAGIADGSILFVRDVSGASFRLAATDGGAAVNLSADGTALVRRVTAETFGGDGAYTITSLNLALA